MYLKTEPLLKSSVTPTTFVWVGSVQPNHSDTFIVKIENSHIKP